MRGAIDGQTAQELVRWTCAAATAEGLEVTAAVVDPGGHLLVLVRTDAAFPGSVVPAIEKARCAALFRRPTSRFSDSHRSGSPIGHLPGVIPLGGGVPLERGGAMLGAIGVSGAVEATETALVERVVAEFRFA